MTKSPFAAVRIKTRRFLLRSLRTEDVNERYLTWFSGAGATHITASPRSVDDLRSFVAERAGRPDVLFLGIFEDQGLHIGNVKYEPVDVAAAEAVMGIFVGDPAWQGQGVGPEVIAASGAWLRDCHGIARLLLGVARDNPRAIRAYEKLGFSRASTERIPLHPHINAMVLDTRYLHAASS